MFHVKHFVAFNISIFFMFHSYTIQLFMFHRKITTSWGNMFHVKHYLVFSLYIYKMFHVKHSWLTIFYLRKYSVSQYS